MLNLIQDSPRQVETGIVIENMLDGYYRIEINGQAYIARNQSSAAISTGSVVSIATTQWGRFIVSSAARHAADVQTIIIRG